MIVGYARTSTLDQVAGLEAQVRDLKALGCEKIYSEQVSSVGDRPKLDEALGFVREGDAFVVTKLDRLARSVTHMGKIVETLNGRGVALRVINLGVDTATASGKLILNVMTGIAQFEREMMLERQREGISKAKGEGKYKGRKATAQAKADQIRTLKGDGLSMRQIAAKLDISAGSVHAVLKQSARHRPTGEAAP